MNYEELVELRKSYLSGTRIQVETTGLSDTATQQWDKGTVDFIDNIGCVHVTLDNGTEVCLDAQKDNFKRLDIDEQILEAETIKEEIIAAKHRQREHRDNDKTYKPRHRENARG